jgi:hypothetical protein
MDNLATGSSSASYELPAGELTKRQVAWHIRHLGYNVKFLRPARHGREYSFAFRRRGWFGRPTGMTYRGIATSERSLLESALGTAQRLARGTSC